MLTKQLRLDVAELSDVGRRRMNNQDNLAKRIPDSQVELDQAGALFVVADGMGGHAAGEIASTVAVQTLTSAYFETPDIDVLQRLAYAIKRANESILTIARENTEHAGMGTTIVAAVVCQGILYVANIGDSRAYMIRNGKIRQITEDHSWVAEQVRAGVLTESQARNHVHRNVITRSLGTQPNVMADVFVEPVRDHDKIMLCSDGLHGYVEENDIVSIVLDHEPTHAVRKLVDMANEAGGPDNITVTLVHLKEVPEPSQELLSQLRLIKDASPPTQPLTVTPRSYAPAAYAPEPPAPVTEKQAAVTLEMNKKPQRRIGAIIVRLAMVAALILASTAAWYLTVGPYAQAQYVQNRVNADVQSALNIARQTSNVPVLQLQLLANQRSKLVSDATLTLTQSERSQVQHALHVLEGAAHNAIGAYNAMASIVPLVAANAKNASLQCPVTLQGNLVSATQPPAPTPVPATPAPGSTPVATATPAPTPAPVSQSGQFLAAVNTSGGIVPVSVADTSATCGTAIGSNVITLSSAGSTFAALTNTSDNIPTVSLITAGSQTLTPLVTLQSWSKTVSPTNFAYSSSYIAIAGTSSTSSAIYLYQGPQYDGTKQPIIVPTSYPIRSMTIGGNGTLYVLLVDGEIATLTSNMTALHMVADLMIQPALPLGDPSSYTISTPLPTSIGDSIFNSKHYAAIIDYRSETEMNWTSYFAIISHLIPADVTATATPLPTPSPTVTPTATPAPKTGPSTLLTNARTIAADATTNPYIVITDPSGHRVIILKAQGLDLTLVQQYSDTSQLDSVISATFSPDGHTLYLLTNAAIIQIALP